MLSITGWNSSRPNISTSISTLASQAVYCLCQRRQSNVEEVRGVFWGSWVLVPTLSHAWV
jgi:hypothetical protein